MKKEVRLLKYKAIASLRLGVEHFNRFSDEGRADAVLILIDHSFEMLLKSAILHRGGKIREARQKNTIGFDACIRRGLSSVEIKFLTDEQALVLQAINGLRDAAQHHLVDLSENQLYFHAQSGVTLFRDLLDGVFDERLADYLPDRVLPISTMPMLEPLVMFADEVEQVRRLLAPNTRRHAEAEARLRSLAIMDGAIRGEHLQPGGAELRKLGQAISAGGNLESVFPGISGVGFSVDGTGPQINLRITKKEGVSVVVVPEGTPDAGVVAVRRVDELGFYSLGHRELVEKVGLTANKTTAAIRVLNLKEDPDCYKAFRIGGTVHQRYSQHAVKRLKDLLTERSIEDIWQEYRAISLESE